MGKRKGMSVETEKKHSVWVTVRSRLDLQHQRFLLSYISGFCCCFLFVFLLCILNTVIPGWFDISDFVLGKLNGSCHD